MLTPKSKTGAVVDLTGWLVWADVRVTPDSAVVFSLTPVIVGGRIMIAKTDEVTKVLPVGKYFWDLLLEDPQGERTGPYVEGVVTVKQGISRPA